MLVKRQANKRKQGASTRSSGADTSGQSKGATRQRGRTASGGEPADSMGPSGRTKCSAAHTENHSNCGLTFDVTQIEKPQALILVRILAAGDAIFKPMRAFDGTLGTVIYLRRRQFRRGGISWSAARFGSSTEEVNRKAISRLLTKWGLHRLIKTGPSASSRTVTVGLTAEGDAIARALAGLPALDDSLSLLGNLIEGRSDPEGVDYGGRAWLPETTLAGCSYADPDALKKLGILQQRMIPLLAAGLADSTANVHRGVWYCPLVASIPIAIDRQKIKADLDAVEAYSAAFKQEIEALDSAVLEPTERRELGLVPFSCSPHRRGQMTPSGAAN
jgi:hypothetical protein